MTRETKIGLVVGLAFIIVVAILLSDHTATTTDSKPAAKSDIGDNVRESVTTPQPQIPTRADLDRRRPEPVKPPVAQIGVDSAGGPIPIEPSRGGPPVVLDNGPRADGRLPDLVKRHPDELIAVDGVGRPAAGTSVPAKPTPPVVAPKTYVAQAGDSVSRIAQRQMGGDTKANRDALIKANPSLQAEGNPVILGKTYQIPSVGAVVQAEQAKPTGPAAMPGVAAGTKPEPAGTVWYTVKENDNLWRIAQSQLGDGNLWQQIKDLNVDVLRGGETVRANQRIRLPRTAGTTASVRE